MDAERFDNLVRGLPRDSSRRGVARTLAGLSLTGVVGLVLGSTDAAARKKKRKKKKKTCKGGTKKCGKTCIAATSCCSAADCGTGGACAGGACICATGFRSCQGACIADDACCPTDCGPCESCQGTECASDCPTGQECVSGQCRCTTSSCDGCCDGDTCRSGNNDSFCGSDGEACMSCTICKTCSDGACEPLPNGTSRGSCATTRMSGAECRGLPRGCDYGSVEGPKYCLQGVQSCDGDLPLTCTTSTAQCPPGQYCAVTRCGGNPRRC